MLLPCIYNMLVDGVQVCRVPNRLDIGWREILGGCVIGLSPQYTRIQLFLQMRIHQSRFFRLYQDLTALFFGFWDVHVNVYFQTSRTQQGGIDLVGSRRGCHDVDTPIIITTRFFDAIEICQQLVDNTVRHTGMIRPTARGQGIQFIQKQDAGCRRTSPCEQTAYLGLRCTNVLVQNLGTTADHQSVAAFPRQCRNEIGLATTGGTK
mmetsp:Transcript_15709/g.36064  ORF Transcript_15709/g.36064 Transcript_15709/m.36064 type:complete len:207 (+) Transcript_15709:225-845(+)